MLSVIKKYLFLFFLISFAGGYYVYVHKKPCAVALTYTIGTFDSSFGISRADFLNAVAQAEAIWEKPVGRQLFTYDPKGNMLINLIYDQRQKTTQQNNALDLTIKQNRNVADSVKQQYSSLQVQYGQSKQGFDSQLQTYNQHFEQYNAQVAYWNGKGGAPQSEYATLTSEKDALAQERARLEQAQTNVNELAVDVNTLIQKYNLLADRINANVAVVNTFAGKEFSEGEYSEDRAGTRINIYEFSNKQKLVRVLAHELGHALGLEHNENVVSIMYSLNQSTIEKVSYEDLSALNIICGAT